MKLDDLTKLFPGRISMVTPSFLLPYVAKCKRDELKKNHLNKKRASFFYSALEEIFKSSFACKTLY